MDYLHASDGALLKMVATADEDEIQWLIQQCRPKVSGGSKRIQSLYSKKDQYDRQLLHYACMYNEDIVASLLLSEDKGNMALCSDKYGVNPAMYAARAGLLNFVTKWVEKYYNSVGNVDKEGRNILHYCCGGGELAPDLLGARMTLDKVDLEKVTECTKVLMEKGINVHKKDNSGKTPLEYAIEHGLSKVADWILPIPCETNKFYLNKGHTDVLLQESPNRLVGGIIHLYINLCFSCNHGYSSEWKLQGLKRLVGDLHLNVNHMDENKMTVLHYLCYYKYDNEPYGLREALIESILQLGASPHLKDKRGNTPLMCAIEKGFVQFNDLTDPRFKNDSVWKLLSTQLKMPRSASLNTPPLKSEYLTCPACSYKMQKCDEEGETEGEIMKAEIKKIRQSSTGDEVVFTLSEDDQDEIIKQSNDKNILITESKTLQGEKEMILKMKEQLDELMKHSVKQQTTFQKELSQTNTRLESRLDQIKESNDHLHNTVVELQQKLETSDKKCEALTDQVGQLTSALDEMTKLNDDLIGQIGDENSKLGHTSSIY